MDEAKFQHQMCGQRLMNFVNFAQRWYAQSIPCRWVQEILSYEWYGDRLDVFYHLYLASKDGYKNLWYCVQIILCLSHGQSGVERGFSFNKEMTRDNMKEETFVAARAVKDKQAGQQNGRIWCLCITSWFATTVTVYRVSGNLLHLVHKENNSKISPGIFFKIPGKPLESPGKKFCWVSGHPEITYLPSQPKNFPKFFIVFSVFSGTA